MIKIIVLNI